MRLIYKPFAIALGLVAALLSRKLFDQVWSAIDEEDAPKPMTREATWGKVLGAAAVEGATFKVTRAAVDRAGARGFEWLTGFWPGDRKKTAA